MQVGEGWAVLSGRGERSSSLGLGSDVFRLWAGQTVSLFGSRVDYVALPLTAAISLSFLAATAGTLCVRARERTPVPSARERDLGHEIGGGLRTTFGNQVLRAGACAAATYNFFWSAIEAVLILYTVRRLGAGRAADRRAAGVRGTS